jgi:hypothetical protein
MTKPTKLTEMKGTRIAATMFVLTILSVGFGILISLMVGGKKPEVEDRFTYILQKCEPTSLDYARWAIEREKGIKELCPKGGSLNSNKDGGYYVECYKN